MKKHHYFLFFLPLAMMACGKSEKTISPQFKELTEAVYASGNIYPEGEYKVYANADGILQDVFVTEGDSLTAGQIMFHIESSVQDVKASNARSIYGKTVENYGASSPVIKELETALNSAKNKLVNDSLNFVRFKNLYEKSATSQVEFEKASLAYKNSRNDYDARKSSLAKAKTQLYIDMENAEIQYKANSIDQSNYSVRSYINGMVYEVYKKKGEAIRRGEPIALIGSAKKVYAKLVVDELDVARLKLNQEVLIRIDYNKNHVYKARVAKIYPKLNKEDQSFRVDAVFTEENPPVLYGLTVEANIVISTKPKTLTIPKSVLLDDDSVEVMESGEKKKIKIEKGVENMELVEVLKGLDDKSQVILKEK